MNSKTFKKKRNKIHKKIEALENKFENLKQKFLKANAIPGGTKVKLTFGSGWVVNGQEETFETEAFVHSVNTLEWDGSIIYNFQKVKKDGSMSKVSLGTLAIPLKIERLDIES